MDNLLVLISMETDDHCENPFLVLVLLLWLLGSHLFTESVQSLDRLQMFFHLLMCLVG